MSTHRKRRYQTALEVEGPHAQHNSVRVHPLLAECDDQVRILRVVKDTVIAAVLSILVSSVEHRLCETYAHSPWMNLGSANSDSSTSLKVRLEFMLMARLLVLLEDERKQRMVESKTI